MSRGPTVEGGGSAPAEGRRRLIRAAGVVGAATLLSRALGYVRDMIIAVYFGAGFASDAFFAAFRIPSLLRELLGEGALSASFIPVLAGEMERAGRPRAMRLAGAAFTALAAAACALAALGIAIAPALVTLVAPGFRGVPGKWELTVTLTRWMFPFLLLVALAALMGGLLNALHHFATPALAPVAFNVAMIGTTLLLARRLDPPVLSLAFGVLLGGAAMLAIQIPASVRRGFAGPRWPHRDDAGLRRIARLMLPATAGLGVTQVNVWISGLLASFLAQGSVSYLFYAMRLVQFPIGVVGVAIGTVALPAMSAGVARQEREVVAGTLASGLRLALFLTAPILAALVVFSRPIVRVLFERGAFTPEATAATSLALLGYSSGLIFYVSNRLLTTAFYAFHDTRTPVLVAAVAVAVNLLVGWALMGPLQAPGLALATALASLANCALLLLRLRARLGQWYDGEFLGALGRMGAAAIIAGGLGWALLAFAAPAGDGGRAVIVLLVELLLMGATYVALARLFRCQEVRWAAQALTRRATPVPTSTPVEDGL
ncbi:MAG TPA: murein biosynthesis integral membrane protein MurJ [Candidatus Methylomirabilis sp.]